MEEMEEILYPIGIQSFEKIRTLKLPYVDKTGYIRRLLNTTNYAFLSRPRRFGKSLLVSTLEAYFLGKKELFDGLEISKTETEWISYPVLHFDLSRSECTDPEKLEAYLKNTLINYENQYGVHNGELAGSIGERFGWLLQNIKDVTGKNSVVLIDEYDKGIVDVIDNASALARNQEILRPFFSQLKSMDAYIHYGFITGVARFRHYTLFSGMNNPDDISFDGRFAAICGITLEELLENFGPRVEELALTYGLSHESLIKRLIQKYDGNRFTDAQVSVFNPYCLLKVLSKLRMDDFWLTSGTSKVFIDYLTKTKFDITTLTKEWYTSKFLSGLYDTENPIPLLFQTGYLTIADFNLRRGKYKLRIPNGEVRNALLDDLAPIYLGSKIEESSDQSMDIREYLEDCDLKSFVKKVDSIIARVPYTIFLQKNAT